MLPELQTGVAIAKGLIDIIKSVFGLRKKKEGLEKKPDNDSPLMVAKRFVQLFDEHGVKRSQIPAFFGHRLTLEKLKDDETLLAELTESVLDDAVKLFGVRREWLDGESDRIYQQHDYYKHPETFRDDIEECLKNRRPDELGGYVMRLKQQGVRNNDDTLLVLKEKIGSVGERSIYRFHFSNAWTYGYWKAKVYLAACVAIAWDNDIHIQGVEVKPDYLKRLRNGEGFVGYDYGSSWVAIPHYLKWYVEDMVLEPDSLIEHIDEAHGIGAALKLWLDLYDEGYMRIDNLPASDARERFALRLDRLVAKS